MSTPRWYEPPAVVESSDQPVRPYVPPPQPIGQPESPVPCLLAAAGSLLIALAGAVGAVAWIRHL